MFKESFHGLHKYGEAESHQEDGIDKSADNLVEKKVKILVPLR